MRRFYEGDLMGVGYGSNLGRISVSCYDYDYDYDGFHDWKRKCRTLHVPVKKMKKTKQTESPTWSSEALSCCVEEAAGEDKDKDKLRAAILKCRFADTILRAKQKQGMIGVDVRRYRLGAKAELRREVQKQREAARKKLEDLERSVDVQDNFKVLRDFQALIRCPLEKSSFVSVAS